MTKGYEFHPEAEDDFTGIWDFIAAEVQMPPTALPAKLSSKIDGLVKFPYQGHSRSDLTSRPLRFVRIYDCLIAYARDFAESGRQAVNVFS